MDSRIDMGIKIAKYVEVEKHASIIKVEQAIIDNSVYLNSECTVIQMTNLEQ